MRVYEGPLESKMIRPQATATLTIAPRSSQTIAVVIVAGILLFLPFLGTLGLWDPWETHYGEVAREMIQRDDYVSVLQKIFKESNF